MSNRYTVAAFIAAVLVVSAAGRAAAQDAHEIYRGTMVNLTTCVAPSLDDDDEFVLTHIVDSPAHPPLAGKVIYWVKEVKKISPYVGTRIQFDARIDDVDRKEIEVKRSSLNGNGGSMPVVKIELAGNNVRTTPDTVGISATAPPDDDDEISIRTTTVELEDVKNLRVVSNTCNVGMMTASAAELTTETRTEAVNAVGTLSTALTPSVEVSRETEVAVEAAPTPAPEVAAAVEAEVESPAPTLSAEIATERTELPATATPLPLVGLIGLIALGGASALRLRRR